jgi:prophage antirepressor-like protein
MYELARLTPFVFSGRPCRVTAREGNLWFVAKDVCEILEIKIDGHTFKEFSKNEKAYVICEWYSNDGTSDEKNTVFSNDGTYADARCAVISIPGIHEGPGNPNVLIINEAGVMRLVLKSRKENAGVFKERIIKLLADYREYGLNRALLPKIWPYGEKELGWSEWINKRKENYFRLHPDKDLDDFMRSLPY